MKRFVCVMALVLAGSIPASALAALDMFLKIDGIPGESVDDKHENWIDLLSFSWGVTNAVTGNVGSGGPSAPKPVFAPFSYTQLLDAAVPATFLAAVQGKHIEHMTLDLVKPGQARETFFQMVFDDVLFASVSMTGNTGSGVPEVAVKATYSKVRMTYTRFDDKGGAGKKYEAAWDLKENAKAAFSGDPTALLGLLEAGGSFDNGNLKIVTSVPEPSTLVTMLVGLAAVLGVALSRLKRERPA